MPMQDIFADHSGYLVIELIRLIKYIGYRINRLSSVFLLPSEGRETFGGLLMFNLRVWKDFFD
jgi:hypothetical protein